ncbi:MAG: hypothetical protein SGARI_003173, partial [Bacillariaceae sp.]
YASHSPIISRRLSSTAAATSDDNGSAVLVRRKYRSLARLVNRLPEDKADESWKELRSAFRSPLAAQETVDQRLKRADERITFLKMITPKPASQELGKGGRWVYRDGKVVKGASSGTKRDQNGKVISNWDGKNMDPENVKRHNQHLKRLGYRNNAHAKGIF